MSFSLRSPHEPAQVFDALDYAFYLRRRWRFCAIACGVAGLLALGVTMLLPKRYTSTANVVIEPPAGADSRAATTLSAMYLESLKTYELYATSDTLFVRALDRFNLRDRSGSQSVEGLKRRVLKVSKIRDTRVMQISATLQDARQAQALAQFLAEETVKLNATLMREAGADLLSEARRQGSAASAEFEAAQAAWGKASTDEPVEALRAEVDSMVDLLYRLRRTLADAEATAVEFESKAKSMTGQNDAVGKAERESFAREGASMRARAELILRQTKELDQNTTIKNRLLADRSAHLEQLNVRRRNAQNTYDAAARRLHDVEASVSNGERLRIIDPGIVAERPSEPKAGQNVAIAVGFALLASIVYLSFAFGLRQ